MDFDDIGKITSPQEYNHQLDAFLAETQYLSGELIQRLYDAYSYDSAATVQWAIAKLLILRTRIAKNEIIEVEKGYPLTVDSFNRWVNELFPNINDQVKF